MLLHISVQPWRWLGWRASVWGIACERGEWLELSAQEPQLWRQQPLSWVTPWGALILLNSEQQPQRWLWLPKSWLGDANFRRLTRFLLRWRQYGRDSVGQ